MPAKIPTGVPIAVPMNAISRLPAIALSRPPELPGGGVISVNKRGPKAWNPAWNSVIRIQNRNARPNTIASSDMMRFTRLTSSRRE